MYRARFSLIPALTLSLLAISATANDLMRDLPIDVQAEDVFYDADRGATQLRENVRIARGELVVHADEGWAYQSEGRLQRVELTGNPATWRMRHEDGTEAEGQAERIIYEALENRVTMTGNARARDARGSFSGQRLVYDIDTQAAEGGGGVRMILEPETRTDSEGP